VDSGLSWSGLLVRTLRRLLGNVSVRLPTAVFGPVIARPPSKRFGERRAVDSLSIQVPRGVIAGLVGPNGAGKTTTLRLLLGLIRPTGGNAAVLGQSIHHPRSFMRKVGALIEGPAFHPTLSGRANLSTLATLGRHRDADISELLCRGVTACGPPSVNHVVGEMPSGRAFHADDSLSESTVAEVISRAKPGVNTAR
jgi:hypothetical protein